MRNQKQISTPAGTIIIVVVAVALFGGALAYQYFAKQNFEIVQQVAQSQPQVETQSAVDETTDLPVQIQQATEDWKTYTNTEYGFEFKYPPSLGQLIAFKQIMSSETYGDICIVGQEITLNFFEKDFYEKNKEYNLATWLTAFFTSQDYGVSDEYNCQMDETYNSNYPTIVIDPGFDLYSTKLTGELRDYGCSYKQEYSRCIKKYYNSKEYVSFKLVFYLEPFDIYASDAINVNNCVNEFKNHYNDQYLRITLKQFDLMASTFKFTK